MRTRVAALALLFVLTVSNPRAFAQGDPTPPGAPGR